MPPPRKIGPYAYEYWCLIANFYYIVNFGVTHDPMTQGRPKCYYQSIANPNPIPTPITIESSF